MISKDMSILSYPKPNIDEYHSTYEFEISIVENILNGEIKTALKLYEDFIRKNTIYSILDSKNIAYLKSYIISISLLICHSVIKEGVSTYSVKAKYHAFSKLIEKAHSEVELINIGKMMIKAYSTQLMHNKNSVDSVCIRKAIDYIHDNLGEDISLDMVSDHVSLSRCYFCTKFKIETNMSFTTYLTHARIEKSKYLLANSDKSILDIAILVGFNSQSYYTHQFKKQTGISPTSFRDRISDYIFK